MKPMNRRDVLKWSAVAGAVVAVPGALAACGSGGGAGTSSATPMPTVPSPSATTSVTSAQSVAALVAWEATQAAQAGSYGIAGALIDNASGAVLQTMRNGVFERLAGGLKNNAGASFVIDPTKHGERQLVSWYFANRDALNLPEPAALTVVTTLDPCLMCAGSLLTAGFNVGVVAYDDYSGVNFKMDARFMDLPVDVRDRALATFTYYAIDGGRAMSGSSAAAYASQSVSQQTANDCATIYSVSASEVRAARGSGDVDIASLQNPATADGADAVRKAFAQTYAGAFTLTQADYRRPDAALKRELERLVAETPGATNAIAYLDPFGNVLTAATDTPSVSAIATAMLNVNEAYAQTRFALMNDAATNDIAYRTLTSPKFGTYVWLHAPDPWDSRTIMDIGIYGSAVASTPAVQMPSGFLCFNPPAGSSMGQLRALIPGLPTLYSANIGVSPQLVTSA